MKKIAIINVPRLLTVILLGSMIFTAKAQKLPKVQSISLRAPTDIKIDGKTTEWNDVFQAYNRGNYIFYTLSNDNDNIYLTMRTDDALATEKVIDGITFTIQLPEEKGSKKSKESVAIVFPTLSNEQKTGAIKNIIRSSIRRLNDTTIAGKKSIDSLALVGNQKMGNLFKKANVTGIKEIQEPSIPIYNIDGIKLAAQFNSQMKYIYELAIPLKYLGTAINSGRKFNYTIKINGVPEVSLNGFPRPMVNGAEPDQAPTGAYLDSPTDFSGEYKLAKK